MAQKRTAGLGNLNKFVYLVLTQSQETQKTIDIAAMLVSQAKEIIRILLLRVHQHGAMTSGENRQL